MQITSEFWRNKRVLLTGHTGFKGTWLALWLQRLGANVTGVSLNPITTPNLFTLARIAEELDSRFCDVRDYEKLKSIVDQVQPEIVFHLAAQPLVRNSYHDPLTNFSTNVMGTTNLLESLRNLDSVNVAVIVTTDKVYRNFEHSYPYRETDELGGHDPYSASKAASEIVVASYRNAFLATQGVAVATARAGNVIGGGDWSEDRLIPDAVRAWQKDKPLKIRNPNAIRPWQHVLEPLAGYLQLVEKLWTNPELAGAFNFGSETSEIATVGKVVELAKISYGGDVIYHDTEDNLHEAGILTLEIVKARLLLGFTPRWGLTETVNRTMSWYQRQYKGGDARSLCLAEISDYETIL
ncbi:MAG: CDP-glucose 4,6-dehydratase [Methylococcales bacterium]|nr:CDP-glucose 4,6-dehydratase [Methylococcales bacterium]